MLVGGEHVRSDVLLELGRVATLKDEIKHFSRVLAGLAEQRRVKEGGREGREPVALGLLTNDDLLSKVNCQGKGRYEDMNMVSPVVDMYPNYGSLGYALRCLLQEE